LDEIPLTDAYRIGAKSGAHLLAQQFNAKVPRGQGRYPISRLPYGMSQAIEVLSQYAHVVLIGAAPPVAPFAYPGRPGYLHRPDAAVHVFARPEQDISKALAQLADILAAPRIEIPSAPHPQWNPRGAVTQDAVASTLASLLPENAIVVDESVSFGRSFFPGLAGAPPHDWLQITGGAIGSGLPMATGAAIAAPGRRVVTLQADGSAMYTVQALWTQARERLPITTVILSNRRYEILIGELANVGANPGLVAMQMMNLTDPDIGWVKLAQGLGVEAARADDLETFSDLFGAANRVANPFLIELVLPDMKP
jgi:acetolactate synthase-1/2/3 large subunit